MSRKGHSKAVSRYRRRAVCRSRRFNRIPRGALVEPAPAAQAAPRRTLPWVAAVGIVCATIGGGIVWSLNPAAPAASITRFSLSIPGFPTQPAFSPDGTQLVHVQGGQLFVRSLDDMEPRPLPGTALAAANPVFSPDGQWVAFRAERDQTLKKVALAGGPVLTLCKAGANQLLGMSWEGDRIVYGLLETGIFGVSAEGGEPELLVPVKPPQIAGFPQLLEDGRTLLFTMTTEQGATRWDTSEIVMQTLATGERDLVLRGGSAAKYVPTGHVVYAAGETILAVPFDLRSRTALGGPIPIADGVQRGGNNNGMASFAFSASGSFAFVRSGASSSYISRERTLAMADRKGNVQPLALPPAPYYASANLPGRQATRRRH